MIWSQKVIEKRWENQNISKIVVNAKWASKISFSGEQNFSGVSIKYLSDGEYENNVIPKFRLYSEILYLNEDYSPIFSEYNDKLSAHKFVSSQIELTINSKISLTLFANDTKISGKGTVNFLKINQNNGSCRLDKWKSEGEINTINADVFLLSEGIVLSAKSINGKVIAPKSNVIVGPVLKISSLNGNIIHK